MPNEELMNYPFEEEYEDAYIDVICPHCSEYFTTGRDAHYIRCINCHTTHHKSEVRVLSTEEFLNNNCFGTQMRDYDENKQY